MNTKMRVSCLALVAVAGCAPPGGLGSTREGLWGGQSDVDTPEANVVIYIAAPGTSCSGTLISPGIVMTALHCVNGTDSGDVGFRTPPVVSVGAGKNLGNFTTSYSVAFDAQPLASYNKGLDVALVYLNSPILEQAKTVRPSFTADSWPGDVNGGAYGGTFGFAGWSPKAEDNTTNVFTTRQVKLDSPAQLEHEPVYHAPWDGQEWMRGGGDAGLRAGDSGGPLFKVRNDPGCVQRGDCNTRDPIGVASYFNMGLDNSSHWTDVTRGAPRAWVLAHVEDHSHDAQPNWMRMHPATKPGTMPPVAGTTPIEVWQETAGPRWRGEADYTGPCESFIDLDCDHWYDKHDNCPTVANFDQADSDDDGVGDACPVPGAPSNCVAYANCGSHASVHCDLQNVAEMTLVRDGQTITSTMNTVSPPAVYLHDPSELATPDTATYSVCAVNLGHTVCSGPLTVALNHTPCSAPGSGGGGDPGGGGGGGVSKKPVLQ